MSKKYICYSRHEIYAIYYRETRIIYYNIDFCGTTKIILLF